MTQEIMEKAKKIQDDINEYEIVIRYSKTNQLVFCGMIGKGDLSKDKELAKIIYTHCKKKQDELIEEYRKL